MKAILCQAVSLDRVFPRDTKTYFGVLLDDNNRKPLCRLWFNAKQKYLGVFDHQKKETRIPIDGLDEIYHHASKIIDTLSSYDGLSTSS